MYAGIYSAASAMDMAERRHELTSQNLAAAHLPGYRRRIEVSRFEDLDRRHFGTEIDQAQSHRREHPTASHADSFRRRCSRT